MQWKTNNIILIALLLTAGGLFVWHNFFRDDFSLPSGGETATETIMLKDGQITTDTQMSADGTDKEKEEKAGADFETKEIMVTDGVKHSIPLDEIISGGPPKDGIPSIDDPKFISVSEAGEWLADTEPGIAFSRGNTQRFYPYQILVWHEIVNDTVDGQRALVTYCPLCLTGFVLDPLVAGERVEFGTSGKLWKSNLVMYDRKTDSLWSQILGEAVVGEMTGTRLAILPSDQIRFGDWKQRFPGGEVLSRDTGAQRFYGSNPYGGYFEPTSFAVSMAKSNDDRLPREAFVFGVVINGKAKAYAADSIKARGQVEDTFQGTELLLRHDQELDAVRVFKKLPSGEPERINPFSSFWFSWSAVHPDTELYE